MEQIKNDLQDINRGDMDGVTYNRDLTSFDGDSGYIATLKAESFDSVSVDDLESFVDEYESVINNLDEYTFKFGIFRLESGKIDIDLNVHVDEESTAVEIGRNCNQESVWDVANKKCIPTGGRGEQVDSVREVLQ